MSFSFWEKEAFLRHVDVAIIGAGLVGLNAALALREQRPNAQIVVLERHPLNGGGSSRNAGFACFGSPSELLDDLQTLSEDEMLSLVERRWKGLQALRATLGDDNIGWNPVGGTELFSNREEALYQQCIEALPSLNQLLKDIVGPDCYESADELLAEQGLRGMTHALRTRYEGSIHTGRMYRALRRKAQMAGVDLLSGMDVKEVQDGPHGVELSGDGWKLRAQQALVANNGFASTLLPGLDVLPARNLVMVTTPIKALRLRGTFHMERGYIYFRSVGEDRLLIGGARHLDKSWQDKPLAPVPDNIREVLLTLAREQLVPETSFAIDSEWLGYLGIGQNKQPIVESVSERLFCAVKMGGMGVAIGTQLGREAATLLLA